MKKVTFLSKIALRRRVVRIGLGILLLLFLSLAATAVYVNKKKNDIAQTLIQTLNEEYSGDIQFGSVSLDRWSNLTDPALSIKDLTLKDSTAIKEINLKAGEVEVFLSLDDLLDGLIQVKSVSLKNGSLVMDNYKPLTKEEELGIAPPIDSLVFYKKLSNKLLEKQTELSIINLDLQIRHHVKNKLFKFHINEIRSEVDFQEDQIKSQTSMDVKIDALGFNLEKGKFINGALVNGSFNSTFNLNNRQLSVPSFELGIDEQVFNAIVEINFRGLGEFDIILENDQTQFQPTVGLLTEKLQEKLAVIDLKQPMHTRTQLKGTFIYKGNPSVDVKFRTKDNSAVFDGNKNLENLELSGRFINRVYDDERADTENKKNFRIQIPKLRGSLKEIQFQIDELLLSSSPDAENMLEGRVTASGNPASLNDFLETQHWSFQGGNFELNTELHGQGTGMGNIVAASNGSFNLRNTKLTNNDNQVSLPVDNLAISLGKDQARLVDLKIPIRGQSFIDLKGSFRNFSALFDKESGKRLQTRFDIYSNNLVWEEFIKLFDLVQPNKEKEKPQLVLQDLLKDIYRKYDPTSTVILDRVQFGEIVMSDLKTGLHYEGENLLILDQTSFGMQGGQMVIDGALNLRNKNQILMNATLNGSASVEILDLIFDEDQLDFDKGTFQVEARLNGDLMRLEKLLSQSYTALEVDDTKITFVPQGLEIPVKKVDLVMDKDLATLKRLSLKLGEADELNISGEIEHLSSLLFNDVTGDVRSELNISAEKLVWEDYVVLFSKDGDEEKVKEEKDPEAILEAERRLKASLREIGSSLNPRVTVDINEFILPDMAPFQQFHTGLTLKEESTLQLEETRFRYNQDSEVKMTAEIDISDNPDTHVNISLEAKGNPEQLNEVFNNDTFFFQGGHFDVSAAIAGDIAHLDSLVAHSKTDLNVSNTTILHKPSSATIPLKELQVNLNENAAQLKTFELEMASGDILQFSGEVDHISDLIFDVPPERSRSSSRLNLYSKRLTFEDFQQLFALAQADTLSIQATEEPPTAIKPTIRDVYNKFRPAVIVQIDEFDLNGLPVSNLRTGFHFVDQNLIYLEKSGFDFYDGSVSLDAHLDISVPNTTYFSFGFGTEKVDLEKLLEEFDYFGMDALKNAERIGGLVSLETEFEGLVDDYDGLLSESLKGNISFNLEETQLAGFEPMIKSGSKIFKKERLQDIRFSPISNTMFLEGNKLEIPLMEIQSSAFEIFIAGHLGFEDVDTNLWIGFPLDNLKSRDIKNVPSKEGYIASGRKVYVQAKSHEKKGIKYSLHLNPKKYYKARDIMDSYRAEIKAERQEIRNYKRESRKADRDSRKAPSSEGNP